MTTIHTILDLPQDWMRMYSVKDEAEALRIAAGRKAYFMQSQIIVACYLFVPVEEMQ